MILTISNALPPERYDRIGWISARLEQSDTEAGSYSEIETIAFLTVDVDPRFPAPRSFTTELAQTGKWYRLVFVASDDSESEPMAGFEFTGVADALIVREDLAALLKVDATANAPRLDRVILAASGEVFSEIGSEIAAELTGWKLALAQEVCEERATEHWAQLKSPFGFIGLGGVEHSVQTVAARNSWDRHAFKLAPVKQSWGIA